MANTLLKLPEVIKITGLSRSSIYLRISERTFPAQIPFGRHGSNRSVRWIESEILSWLQDRIDENRKRGKA